LKGKRGKERGERKRRRRKGIGEEIFKKKKGFYPIGI
jgi:hypothetical protein